MKSIEVHGRNQESTIMIGESLLNLKSYLPETQTIVISDPNVINYYRPDFPPADVIPIGIGEAVKNLETVENIYERLVRLDADRSCFIVGIGGGIVCDITGFVASTYLRGVRFAFVSSTLLSQVDASVGGKNGVNFSGYKNMVGTFNQPDFVVCDINLLKTLPEKEVLCGFAEIVKQILALFRDICRWPVQNPARGGCECSRLPATMLPAGEPGAPAGCSLRSIFTTISRPRAGRSSDPLPMFRLLGCRDVRSER